MKNENFFSYSSFTSTYNKHTYILRTIAYISIYQTQRGDRQRRDRHNERMNEMRREEKKRDMICHANKGCYYGDDVCDDKKKKSLDDKRTELKNLIKKNPQSNKSPISMSHALAYLLELSFSFSFSISYPSHLLLLLLLRLFFFIIIFHFSKRRKNKEGQRESTK